MRKTCLQCGNDFAVKPSRYDKTTYCSRRCMAEHYSKRLSGAGNPRYSAAGLRVCQRCGKEYESYKKDRQFCSLACYNFSDQKRENARRANDKIRRAPGKCKQCGDEIPARRNLCDGCLPSPRRPGKCLHCGGPSGSDRDVKYCRACRLTGIHKKIPLSICQSCGFPVYVYNRIYCNTCFRVFMSAKRGTPAKIDQNQPEIVAALESIGCLVMDLSPIGGGCPDLLVSFRDTLYLLEVKNPKARGKLNKLQQAWHEEWQGRPVAVVYSIEEALHAIGAS